MEKIAKVTKANNWGVIDSEGKNDKNILKQQNAVKLGKQYNTHEYSGNKITIK